MNDTDFQFQFLWHELLKKWAEFFSAEPTVYLQETLLTSIYAIVPYIDIIWQF